MAKPLRNFSIGPLLFHRRPVSEVPPDNTICAVDNGDDTGWQWRSAARFSDGIWTDTDGKPLQHEPTHWIELIGAAKRGR